VACRKKYKNACSVLVETHEGNEEDVRTLLHGRATLKWASTLCDSYFIRHIVTIALPDERALISE